MRAGILARVSDETQARADRHSIPMQLEMMREYVASRGWELARVFEIPGESAFREYIVERPQFRAAIEAALRGEFDVLVVYDLTRFARSQALLHETLRDLRKAGVRLMVWSGDWDATEDRTRAGLEGIIAEAHSLDHSRRVKHALSRRWRLGLHVGDLPFGYRSEAPDKPGVVVPEEADAIRWGFEAYTAGLGYQAISSEWNRRGLRPRSKRGLVAFGTSSVQSVLENAFYAGWVTLHGERRRGQHEPVISDELFEEARGRVRRQSRGERQARVLLSGLAECWDCGGPLWSKKAGQARVDGSRRWYYWEASRVRGRSCEAQDRVRRVEDVDPRVEAAIRGMANDPRWFAAGEREALSSDEAAMAERRRAELAAKRERLGLAMAEGMLSVDRVREEQARIDRELASLPVDGRKVFVAGERFVSLWEAYDEQDMVERNRLMHILFDGVMVDVRGEGVRVRARNPFRALFEARAAWVETKGAITPDRTRTPFHTSGVFDLRELVVA